LASIVGLTNNTAWTKLVRRPRSAQILDYLVQQWGVYERFYIGKGQAFSRRKETVLTKGFGAYITQSSVEQTQPFHGNFRIEHPTYILNPDGSAKAIARTDIQWELYGVPIFVVEMKVIGGGRPATAYVRAGVTRFVSGQYSKHAVEGAMWAFLRVGSRTTCNTMGVLLDRSAHLTNCISSPRGYLTSPSRMAPNSAAFDTIHEREQGYGQITLAHVIVRLTH
jgi:hypothetical protein